MMFKIECYAEDKNLAKVLRALASAGARDVAPMPMANIKPAANGKVADGGNGDLSSQVHNQLMHAGKQTTTADEVRDIIAALGFSRGSAIYAIQRLVKAKLLKATGKGKYNVMKGKSK